MKQAKPLTPLINPMSARWIVFGHMLFLAILAFAFHLSWMVGVILCTSSFLGIGLKWFQAYRVVQKFLRSGSSQQTVEWQSDTSFSLFQDFAAVSAWIPVLGMFLFHERFSSVLRALRERYESTYWDAMLERAYRESLSGYVSEFVSWFENASALEEKKRTEATGLLDILLKLYEYRVDAHEKEDADYRRFMEKEDAAIASGNKETVRDFYRVHMSKIFSEYDILCRTELLSKKKEIIAILLEIKEMITVGDSIDVCVKKFIHLSSRIFF